MSFFSKIGEGIKNATKFVGKKVIKPVAKGVANATKWQVNNIGKAVDYGIKHPEVVAGVAATVLTGGAALGAVAPALGAKLATNLGKTKIGSILGKAVDTGVVLNQKLKGTLQKSGLPSDDQSADALAQYVQQQGQEQYGVNLLKSSTIDANYKVKEQVANQTGNLVDYAKSLFGGNMVDQTGASQENTGSSLVDFAKNLFSSNQQQQQQQNSSMMGVLTGLVAGNQNKTVQEGESTIDKLLTLKMMDTNQSDQPQEKESFFEKLFMMKEIMKDDDSQINVQNDAQAAAFASLQQDLQASKFQQMVDSAKQSAQNNPSKTLLIGGGILAALIAAMALIFKRN